MLVVLHCFNDGAAKSVDELRLKPFKRYTESVTLSWSKPHLPASLLGLNEL